MLGLKDGSELRLVLPKGRRRVEMVIKELAQRLKGFR